MDWSDWAPHTSAHLKLFLACDVRYLGSIHDEHTTLPSRTRQDTHNIHNPILWEATNRDSNNIFSTSHRPRDSSRLLTRSRCQHRRNEKSEERTARRESHLSRKAKWVQPPPPRPSHFTLTDLSALCTFSPLIYSYWENRHFWLFACVTGWIRREMANASSERSRRVEEARGDWNWGRRHLGDLCQRSGEESAGGVEGVAWRCKFPNESLCSCHITC